MTNEDLRKALGLDGDREELIKRLQPVIKATYDTLYHGTQTNGDQLIIVGFLAHILLKMTSDVSHQRALLAIMVDFAKHGTELKEAEDAVMGMIENIVETAVAMTEQPPKEKMQ